MAAPPSSSRHLAWLLLAVLALLAGTLWRSAHLDSRPLHADEAVQAWLTWNLLHGEGYRYDPLDRHGPLLYYGAAAFHVLRGRSPDTFNDISARSFVVLAGFGTLALLALAPRFLDGAPAVGAFAATLLAGETLSTLYHTYFVQEAWLAALVWSFYFLLRADPSPSRSLLLGLVAGLAQTTKEIAPVYLLLTWAAVNWGEPRPTSTPTFPLRHLALASLAFAMPVLCLYSSVGAHPAGVIDALRTYPLQLQRVSGEAHHYPWWTYFKTLGLAGAKPVLWAQVGFLLAGAAGLLLALRRDRGPGHRSAALLTGSLLILHSAVPYKTPWLLLTPVIGLALVGGHALARLSHIGPRATLAALLLALASTFQSTAVGRIALDRYPGDSRNPYFYEQAPRAFHRLPARIAQLSAASDRPPTIAVVSPEHAWPLPWYLRGYRKVGYFSDPPPDVASRDIVIWDSQVAEVPASLFENRIVEYVGLRPGVLLTVSIAQDVWEAVFPPTP